MLRLRDVNFGVTKFYTNFVLCLQEAGKLAY